MSRPKNSVPKYCVDQTGRAFTKVNGRFLSLGKADSPESKLRFAKVLEDHAKGVLVSKAEKPAVDRDQISINELAALFVGRELARFSPAERYCQLTAIRLLRKMFGETPVDEFGPLRLRVLRDARVAGDLKAKGDDGKPCPRKPWSRDSCNRQVKRIQALFRWGVSFEMVPESVAAALSTIRILMPGETTAKESEPRRAVSQADFDAAKARLKPLYRDVLQLMALTGARPGELVNLRVCDLERNGEVWRADLKRHKTSHKGKRRVLFFNAAAQAILLKHMKADPDALILGCRRDNFSSAVRRACKRAGVAPFVPHEVRHTVATRLADEVGLEAAQRLLGHSTAAMTQHYSKSAERQAITAAKSLG